jgi:hypothetical protein
MELKHVWQMLKQNNTNHCLKSFVAHYTVLTTSCVSNTDGQLCFQAGLQYLQKKNSFLLEELYFMYQDIN